MTGDLPARARGGNVGGGTVGGGIAGGIAYHLVARRHARADPE